MKNITILLFLQICFLPAFSQLYQIVENNGQTVNTCSGYFFENVSSAMYANGLDLSMTFCSDDPLKTHIRVYFYDFDIHPSDTLFIYNGPNTNSPLLGAYNNNNSLYFYKLDATTSNISGCLTFRFKSDSAGNGSGWTAIILCITACQEITATIDSLAMVPVPHPGKFIDICYGDTVQFAGNALFPQNNFFYNQSIAASQFIWDFGDGSTDTGMNVSHVYSAAQGYTVGLTVLDIKGCRNINSINYKVRISENPISSVAVPPEICIGNDLNLSTGYNSFNTIQLSSPTYFQSYNLKNDSAFLIPDSQCRSSIIPISCYNPGQTITSLSDLSSIKINMEHSFVGDLQIKVTCPNGNSAILKQYLQNGSAYLGLPMGGISGPNNHDAYDCGGTYSCNPCTAQCITDPLQNAPGTGWTYDFSITPQYNTMQSYANAGNCMPPAPWYGGFSLLDSTSYQPYEPFSNFIGCPINGNWRLDVCDYWNIDNGWVFWWSIGLDPTVFPTNWSYNVPVDTIVWQGPFITQSTGHNLTIHPDSSGIFQYQVFIIDSYGCNYDTTLLVNVAPCNGVNDVTETDPIRIFPNPTSGEIYINLADHDIPLSIEIYSTFGSTILSGDFPKTGLSNDESEVNLYELNPGTYILRILFKDHVVVRKILILRM